MEVWIGRPRFDESDVVGDCTSIRNSGVWQSTVQYAGWRTRQFPFFGILFLLPDDDPLAEVLGALRGAVSPYIEGDYTDPWENPLRVTNRDEIDRLNSVLRDLALRVDAGLEHFLAESLLPLELESAWRYLRQRSAPMMLERFSPHQDVAIGNDVRFREWVSMELSREELLTNPNWLGLHTADDAIDYIRSVERSRSKDRKASWTAVASGSGKKEGC